MFSPENIAKLDQLAQLACGTPDEYSILDVAAVGLVEKVWRNSPLEDMHASRRGPSDGEMFAESVALHRVARDALASGTNAALLEFERHLLDRNRPWVAGGRTLQEMGYGFLTAFEKHVKTHINIIMAINDDDGRDVLLKYLIAFTALYGNRHYGMPRWTAIVSGVRDVLQDPAHPAWHGRGSEVIAATPTQAPTIEDLCQALLDAPDELPLPVLDWLTQRGVMMAAQNSVRT
jgi:hypothetical protein